MDLMATGATESTSSQESADIIIVSSSAPSNLLRSMHVGPIAETDLIEPTASPHFSTSNLNDNAPNCMISLKVRTLDHQTHQIQCLNDAFVAQIKEQIATRTGVGTSRQRLIFRGKVLKNEKKISSYALEDGHVLHLVVRAERTATSTVGQDTEREALHTDTSGLHHEENPTNAADQDQLGQGQNRILMGTIAVPTGSNVDVPFLRSMLASMIIPFQDASTRTSGNTASGTESNPQLNSGDPSSGTITMAIASDPHMEETGDSSIARLQSHADHQLDMVSSNLENAAYGFGSMEHRDLNCSSPPYSNITFLQNRLERLRSLFNAFEARLNMLPVAIDTLRSRSDDPRIVISTMRAIRTLESIGDSTRTLCRMAQLMFLNSPSRGINSSSGSPTRLPATFDSAAVRGTSRNLHSRRSENARGRASRSSSRRSRYLAVDAATSAQISAGLRSIIDGHSTYSAASTGFTPYTSVTALSTFAASHRIHSSGPIAWIGDLISPDALEHNAATRASTANVLPTLRLPPPEPNTENNSTTSENTPVNVTRIWNFADFLKRLFSGISVSALYGLLNGDPSSVHEMIVRIGEGIQSGLDMPPLLRGMNHSWCESLLEQIRQQLRQASIPEPISARFRLNEDSGDFVEELIRPFGSFSPEMIDFIVRSLSVTRVSVFGQTCIDFIHTMSRRWIAHLRQFVVNENLCEIRGVFIELLVHFGLERKIVEFTISSLFRWLHPENETSEQTSTVSRETSRRRPRSMEGDTEDVLPHQKRPRL